MGLCKCRQVTTLFCFQCRINVCDKCIVDKHKTCVVNKYMQWLVDSEFDPTCRLCTGQFTPDQPTIRLNCLHVFHFKCLMDYAASLPANTAPAGYACPKCQGPIVPPATANDAVATECRRMLEGVPWARVGAASAAVPPTATAGEVVPAAYNAGASESLTARKHVSIAIPSPPQTTGTDGGGSAVRDPDDDKYARRSVNERFNRVVSNQLEESQKRGLLRDDNPAAGLRRTAIIMLLLMLIAVTTIELLTRAKSSHHNALLDPAHNANVRIE